MRFPDLLDTVMSESNLKNAAQLFELLGGEAKLKCTKRSFDLIRTGERNPTPAFFHRLFAELPHPFRKMAIESFFESSLETANLTDSALMKFLDQNLSPGVPDEHESVWDKNEDKLYFLQPQQMEYMIGNHSALRLFIRTLLYEKIPNHELLPLQEEVKHLNRLGLTQLGREGLYLLHNIVKVPSHKNSSKRMAELGMKYILEHIPAFVDYSDTKKQVISYAMQKVKPEHVEMINKAVNTMNKWIQDLAVMDEGDSQAVPYFFVGLGGVLGEKDF